jgi:hypothetical protein
LFTAPAPPPAAADARVRRALRTFKDGLLELGDVSLDGTSSEVLREIVRALAKADGQMDVVRARAVTAAEGSGAVQAAGAASPSAWLSRASGSSPHSAVRATRLASAIQKAPAIGSALASGRMGAEHATTLASAMDKGQLDANDATRLVDEAGYLTPGAFATETKRRAAAIDQSKLRRDEAHAVKRRSHQWWKHEDGSVEGRYLLDPVAGATWLTGLASLEHPDPARTPDELARTATQRRADAMTDLALITLERGDSPIVRTVKPHITVVTPVTMLDASVDDDACVTTGLLPDGTVLSAATVRRLLCDATVRRLVLDPDGRPLNVGRATRTWSGAQRAATAAIDGGCRGPVCDRPFEWTDLHHLTWWRDGGTTGIANALPACKHCHKLIHDHGWTVTLDPKDRTATWTAPNGAVTTTHPRGPAAPTPRRPIKRRHSVDGDPPLRTGEKPTDKPVTLRLC